MLHRIDLSNEQKLKVAAYANAKGLLRKDGSPHETTGEPETATHVVRVLTEKQIGQIKTKEYIDDVVLLRDEDQGAKQRTIKFQFGTDNTYYLDGRPVILIDPQ